jgi:hypothetical protein
MTERQSKQFKWLKLTKTEHEYVDKRLSAYVDGELSARETARVKAHLEVCKDCRDDLAALRWTKNLLQETPTVPLPRSFVLREVDITPPRPVRRRQRAFAMQWATAIVALLFILVSAGDILTSMPLAGRVPPASQQLAYETAPDDAQTIEMEAPAMAEEKVEIQAEETTTGPVEEKTQITPSPMAKEGLQVESPEKGPARSGVTRVVTTTLPAVVALAEDEKLAISPTPSPQATNDRVSKDNGTPPPTPSRPSERPLPTASPEPEEPQRSWDGKRSFLSSQAVRIGWRVIEIVLGITLVGLVIATVWTRRQT